MKKYQHIKEKAIEMRTKGLTLDEIAERLALGRTTIYSWIKDLGKIEATAKRKDSAKKAGEANKKKYEAIRNASYEHGLREYDKLKKQEFFEDFIMLYLGEGTRRNRNIVAVANSNLEMIILAHYWMKKLSKNPHIDYGVQIHEDNDEEDIKKYWAENLKIEKDDIRITRKSNSGKMTKRNWRSEFGVFTVRIGDTHLKSQLGAWMQRKKDEIKNIGL